MFGFLKKETIISNKISLQGKTLLLIRKVCYLQKQKNEHTKTGSSLNFYSNVGSDCLFPIVCHPTSQSSMTG